jgi:hypothetical protein
VGVVARLSDEQLVAWVAASCQAQGVSVKVSEARTVEQVRVLLTGQAGRTAPARTRGRSAPAGRSQPPHRPDPLRVKGLSATGAWADHGVVEHGAHDGRLSGQVQSGPRSA